MSAPTRTLRPELRAAASIVVGLAVVGALLGLVWAAWSPPGPRALVRGPGAIQPDETEAFVAGDGRFLILAAAVGLVAAIAAWTRRDTRGSMVLLALGVGGTAGSALMWLVGGLTAGGTDEGPTGSLIDQLPLTLHTHGLLFLEGGVAVLVYGVLAAFAARDDLGRDDPVRDAAHAAKREQAARFEQRPVPPPPPGEAPYPSVGAGDEPQYGGRDGDGPGALQQRDLPPQ